jgi:hypothetical protein
MATFALRDRTSASVYVRLVVRDPHFRIPGVFLTCTMRSSMSSAAFSDQDEAFFLHVTNRRNNWRSQIGYAGDWVWARYWMICRSLPEMRFAEHS